MKLLITTMTICALGLVASFGAQDDPNNPNKKHKGQGQSQGQGQGQSNVKQQAVTKTNRTGGQNQLQTGAKMHGQGQGQGKHHGNVNQGNAVQSTNTSAGSGNTGNNANGNKGHKNKASNVNANVNNTGQANNANNVNQGKLNKHLSKQQLHNTPQWQANHQKAQAIHQQHLNFKAQQNQSIASVQFNKNYKIQNAQNWKGNQYVVFKNYQPQWHDQGWWHNHYHNNIFLFAGGWYYWNAGYYYPAWGYDTGQAYYPYDGPIYVGQTQQPLDQTIADVQTSLQEQGFYKGEIDGLMGPLTRAALAEYQQSQGLEATAAMDEPTLESLGMS